MLVPSPRKHDGVVFVQVEAFPFEWIKQVMVMTDIQLSDVHFDGVVDVRAFVDVPSSRNQVSD